MLAVPLKVHQHSDTGALDGKPGASLGCRESGALRRTEGQGQRWAFTARLGGKPATPRAAAGSVETAAGYRFSPAQPSFSCPDPVSASKKPRRHEQLTDCGNGDERLRFRFGGARGAPSTVRLVIHCRHPCWRNFSGASVLRLSLALNRL